MTPYKHLLGLEESHLTDYEIMGMLERARRENKAFVEFNSGSKKVRVMTFPVNKAGIMRDEWPNT